MAGEINAQRHAGGVILPVIGVRKTVGGLQAGFRIQRITGGGDDSINVTAIRNDGRVAVVGRGQARTAVSERRRKNKIAGRASAWR